MFLFKPIKHPGIETLDFKASILQHLRGRLPTTVDVIRSVLGLALPIRCLYIQGIPVGSCSYSDFCTSLVQDLCEMNTSNCSPELASFGIDCNCPLDIPIQTVEGSYTFELPDMSMYDILCPLFFLPGLSFLSTGDFDVKININDASNQHVGCFRFLFTFVKA